eukprot:scaffold9441_cov77-Skeletonema_dohrnii-CCMP3373.AAC.2
MSYATSAKAAKTKSAKANDASSKASKAKVSKSYSYSMSYGPGCERSKCVDPDVPRFIVDRSVDIGDPLLQKEPDMPKRCGCDCYTLKDSGKPPFDLQLGDTQRFAYREVTSTNFSIKSRTCGVKCYVGDEVQGTPLQLTYGRVGLEVRQSLDPFSANVFISHVPQLRAEWSWRENYNGTPFGGVDYSLDETCLWISLTRRGDKFTWTYAYDAYLPGEECESGDIDLGFDPVEAVIDMSETVCVGLAVSSEVYSGPNSFCEYTEADFESIEFACEGDSC